MNVEIDRVHAEFNVVGRPPAEHFYAGRGAAGGRDGAARLRGARRVGRGARFVVLNKNAYSVWGRKWVSCERQRA